MRTLYRPGIQPEPQEQGSSNATLRSYGTPSIEDPYHFYLDRGYEGSDGDILRWRERQGRVRSGPLGGRTERHQKRRDGMENMEERSPHEERSSTNIQVPQLERVLSSSSGVLQDVRITEILQMDSDDEQMATPIRST